MSFGIKSWTVTVLGLVGAVALWNLPPEPWSKPGALADPPAVARWKELAAEVRLTENRLRVMGWADSLSALALATQQDGIAVGMPAGRYEGYATSPIPWLTPEHFAATRAAVRKRMERAAPEGSRVVVGFFLQPTWFGLPEGARHDVREAKELYLMEREGTSLCLLVKASADPPDFLSYRGPFPAWQYTPDTGALSGCAFPARFGLPGPGVTRWLKRGGMNYAAREADSPFRDPEASARKVERLGSWGGHGVEREQCLAGLETACAAVFLDPFARTTWTGQRSYLIENSPVTWIGDVTFLSPFGQDDDYLLSDLVAEFGPERFERFWTSDAEPKEAFEAAFDVTVGAWMSRWVRRHVGRLDRGSTPAKAAYPGTLAVLGLSTLLAGLAARRRKVA